MTAKTRNVAIDGPAGAGKSTIAKLVAKKLGYLYVDTGAMFRALALACLREGISIGEEQQVAEVCRKAEVSLQYENGVQVVLLNGENVNGQIRTEEVGNATSAIAVYQAVREKLLALQRELAARENVIMDGRDIGTKVLPQADTKIFLTASSRVRAERRCLELQQRGEDCQIDAVQKDIEERDYRDSHRDIAPLTQAEDAVLVDASELTIDQVVDEILKIIRGKQE